MSYKIIGILGSPVKNGNTDTFEAQLAHALEIHK